MYKVECFIYPPRKKIIFSPRPPTQLCIFCNCSFIQARNSSYFWFIHIPHIPYSAHQLNLIILSPKYVCSAVISAFSASVIIQRCLSIHLGLPWPSLCYLNLLSHPPLSSSHLGGLLVSFSILFPLGFYIAVSCAWNALSSTVVLNLNVI